MTNREAILRIGEHCRIHFKAEINYDYGSS